MSFYSLGWTDFNALPLYTFWELARNIERIKAEDDIRFMAAVSNAVFGDGKYIDKLMEIKGKVIDIDGDDVVDIAHNTATLKALIGG